MLMLMFGGTPCVQCTLVVGCGFKSKKKEQNTHTLNVYRDPQEQIRS